MNIFVVRDNLKSTISGKEKLRDAVQARINIPGRSRDEIISDKTMIMYIGINLTELQGILNDVERCCEAELKRLNGEDEE